MSQHGWVIIDKPQGFSSTQVTGQVKRLFGMKKAGHAGTLDPLATGLLPIALGEATKTIPYMVDEKKAYQFTIRWGLETTTDDAEGDVTHELPACPSPQQIQHILPLFTGDITQTPPAFSAVKINGKRAYELARKGEAVPLKERQIHIHSLRLLSVIDPHHASFECHCSKGTYIRSLGRDIAHKLETCGHILDLRRTSVGPFSEKNAISLDFLTNISDKDALEDYLLPLDSVLDDIPVLILSGDEERRFRQGQFLPNPDPSEGKVFFCKTQSKSAVGLAQMKQGLLRPFRVFNI